MKIVVLDGYTENPGDLSWSGLEKLGELTVYDRTSPEKIVERAREAEILYTNKTPLSRDTLLALPRVKFIGVLATGYNVVDTAAAKEKGVTVTNIPAYGTAAVAQMTFALLLELCQHVGHHGERVKNGAWAQCPDFCFWDYPLVELAGKTIGIVGYGRIGRMVGKIARSFGMQVLAYSRSGKTGSADENARYTGLDELLRASDVISLHCPLTEDNAGMIGKGAIAKMKDGVMLINTARGPLIEERDLAEALNSGKVAGAALDVLSSEPPQADNPLMQAKNCIITPHIAWAPKESRQRLMDIAVENLAAFLRGEPVHIVNGR